MAVTDPAPPRILIAQSAASLAALWAAHLERQGMDVVIAPSQEAAVASLSERPVDIIILDLILAEGSALAVADYANFRQPEARVIFVTSTSFFSDGSIFNHSANARAFVRSATPPEDLAAMVAHYAEEKRKG